MGLLRRLGAAAPATALCREIAAQYPEAAWAHVQLGLLLLGQGDAEGAVSPLQVYVFSRPHLIILFSKLYVHAAYLAMGGGLSAH